MRITMAVAMAAFVGCGSNDALGPQCGALNLCCAAIPAGATRTACDAQIKNGRETACQQTLQTLLTARACTGRGIDPFAIADLGTTSPLLDGGIRPPNLFDIGVNVDGGNASCNASHMCGCNGLEICYDGCNNDQNCINTCYMYSTDTAAMLDFEIYGGCPMRYCNTHSDGGTPCTAADLDYTSMAPVTDACQACLNALGPQFQSGALNYGTICAKEISTCTANKP
jgi:hypothetical protein